MAGKIQLLAIILAISISIGYARSAKKILMGQAASIGEFPHQVSLQTKYGQHFCGGSIISSTLIITAAHCTVDENGKSLNAEINVVVGTNDKRQHTPDNVFRVVRCITHNFKPIISNKNDIAILKLNRPILFNNLVKPAKLPLAEVSAGTSVMSSGWGTTIYDNRFRHGSNYPRYLQKLERTVVSQEKCQEMIAPKDIKIAPGHICVLSPNGAATCAGDSGGPLTHNDVVIAVTSFGIDGCGQNYPDVCTSIHHYLQWIRTVEWVMANNAQLPTDSRDFVEVKL